MVSICAFISLILYSWTSISLFWKIPSWVLSLTVDEMLFAVAFSYVVNAIETVVVVCMLLFLSFSLPVSFFRDKFVPNSVILVTTILGSMALHLYLFSSDNAMRVAFYQLTGMWWAVTFVITVLLMFFLPQISLVRKFLWAIADRAIIFLYIFVPLSISSILYVIVYSLI
jgi:hypothetical protein